MKLLFIGNSITKGEIGESFVHLLKEQNPGWVIKNAGVNGDTLKNISDRLAKEIPINPDYDFIIIEAGHNDIILPYFNTRGLLFRLALKYLLRKGRNPLNPRDFQLEYSKMLALVQSKSNAKIIVTTLGCINENLSSILNLKRIEYNDIILKMAHNYHCLIADISYETQLVLEKNYQTDYLLNNFLNSAYFDLKKCQETGGADRLSRKRNLILTIDGVHLNSVGAMLYKQAIEIQINRGNCYQSSDPS